MSMHTRISGIWKEITDPQVRISSIWKLIEEGWVRVSGVWKQFFSRGAAIPVDLIVFATDSTDIGDWLKMNGSEASPTLIGKYPRAHASEGDADGSNTHEHVFTGNTGNSTLSTAGTTNGTPQGNNHIHTMNHTHPETNQEPQYLKVLPLTEGSEILTSMFLFYDGDTAPDGWSAFPTAYDKFFKGDTDPETSPTGGSDTHEHVFTGSSGYTTPPTNTLAVTYQPLKTASTAVIHRHVMSHTHGATNNIPEWHGLLPVVPDTEVGEIPSGICAFFKGSVVPDGWSYFSVAAEKWIQGKSTSGGTGGSNSHSHVYSGASSPFTGYTMTNAAVYTVSAFLHTHTINHTHSDPGSPPTTRYNNEPEYQELLFCKKD